LHPEKPSEVRKGTGWTKRVHIRHEKSTQPESRLELGRQNAKSSKETLQAKEGCIVEEIVNQEGVSRPVQTRQEVNDDVEE